MTHRKKRIEHDNHERWMVSYADFITLLFAFFVVMYGISSVSESKYKVFSVAVNKAFGTEGANTEGGVVRLTEDEMYFKSLVDRRNARLAEKQRKQNERMQNLIDSLNGKMSGFVNKGLMTVSQSNRGVTLDINASMLFKPGDAVVQDEAVNTLAEVAKILVVEERPIEVDGHTDNLPISTAQFPSNWELSSARASSVVRLFIEQGIAANLLKATGFADNFPLQPNDTLEGRARNRRVAITVLISDPESASASAVISTQNSH
jgi:chemotaxis protein MotB